MVERNDGEAYDEALFRVKRTVEWERSLIASTVVGVVRDRAISSCYGRIADISEGVCGSPTVPYSLLFDEKVAEHVEQSLVRATIAELHPIYPLYGHESDLMGQLARLLIVCRDDETLDDEARNSINQSIARLGMTIANMKDGNYIRHLRNAVAHGRFCAEVDQQDPLEETKLVFVDVDDKRKEVTAVIEMNAEQLNSTIEIMVSGMVDYLNRTEQRHKT